MSEETKFLEIQALICKECLLCFDVYIDGVPLDRQIICECGSITFTIEDGVHERMPI